MMIIVQSSTPVYSFRIITTSSDFPLLFPLALHESSWASIPLCLFCLAPWSGIRDISHSDPLIDQNIITTYPTISVWSTRICPVFPTFIGHHSGVVKILTTTSVWRLRSGLVKYVIPTTPLQIPASAELPCSIWDLRVHSGFPYPAQFHHLDRRQWTFQKFVSVIPWFTRTGV